MSFFYTPIQVNNILPASRSNGPGLRYVIWVQGCSIHCPGCSNTHTWDPKAGDSMDVGSLVEKIKEAFRIPQDTRNSLVGVTITGGEPLDQYKAIYKLCRAIFPMTSIFLTTGYTIEEIEQRKQLKITDYLDLLCTGPFKADQVCSGKWKGSANQKVYYLTNRGFHLSKLPVVPTEIFINPDGSSMETGFTAL